MTSAIKIVCVFLHVQEYLHMPSKITGIYETCSTTNCNVMCMYYPKATYLLMTFPAVTILSVAHCTPPHHVLPGDMERYSQCLPHVHVHDIVLFTPPRRRSACCSLNNTFEHLCMPSKVTYMYQQRCEILHA